MRTRTKVHRLSIFAVLLFPLLIAATLLQEAVQLFGQPWDTILFALILPVLVQGYRVWRDRVGEEPSVAVVRGIVFLITAVFVFFSGGFAGLSLPTFPTYGGMPIEFIGAVLTYVAVLAELALVAFGTVEGAYQVVLREFLESQGFAPQRNLEARAADNR